MIKKDIAAYFYPTRILVLDDQEDYLQTLSARLGKNHDVITFSNPEKAIHFLQDQASQGSFMHSLFSSLKERDDIGQLECDNMANAYTSINLFDIHRLIYQPNRFQQAIIVISDYAMPHKDGIEFCTALRSLPLKFILLTGKATPETVIQAFHDRIIHGYISKASLAFYPELEKTILNLQKLYFQELTFPIVQSVISNSKSCLADPAFPSLFNEFCKEHHIIEYYLLNDVGSYLLLDAKGSCSIFAVSSEQEMQEYTEIASDHAELAKEVLGALTLREKLLVFLTLENEQHVAGWNHYLFPAKKVKGEKITFYYSHINAIEKYPINSDKILAYQDYLLNL